MHDVQVLDIDAQFHRGRTEQGTDQTLAKEILPLDAGFGAELAGMILATQPFGFREVTLVDGYFTFSGRYARGKAG